MALPKREILPEPVYPEGYSKCVYHKHYDPNGDEANLKKYSKVVKSEDEWKKLGADWGLHPSLKEDEKPSKIVETEYKEPKVKVSLKPKVVEE